MTDSEARKPVLTGYCIEFLQEMARLMNFDYDIIFPSDGCGCIGEKQEDNTWTGLMGEMSVQLLIGGKLTTGYKSKFVKIPNLNN